MSVHEALAAAWDQLVADWSNEGRHESLRALAVEQGELKWLATRYRERQGDAVADAQLKKIASVAMATMLTRDTNGKHGRDVDAPYRRAMIWIIVLLFMLILGLVAAKVVTTAHHPPAG